MANQIDCDVFVRRNALKNPISYVQGTDLLPIIMHFLDFDIPSGATANVFVLKSDQTAIYGTATINGNDVTIDVDDQMFMSIGLALLQVEIVSNNETLVSFAQPVNVEPNLKSGDFPPSETHVMWIDEAIKQAQEAVSDANQALEDARTAITGANNAAAAANEAAENAEQDVQDYLQQNPVSEAVNDYMTAHPVEVTPEVTNHVMTFSEGSQTGAVVENDYAAYTHTEDGDYPLRDLDAQDKIRALAPAIIETASGGSILLTDSGEQALQGLNLYGKSEQESTTGAQLFDISKVISKPGRLENNGDSLHVTTITGDVAASGGVPNKLRDYAPNLKAGQTYYLSAASTGTDKYIHIGEIWNFNSSKVITEEMLQRTVMFYASGQETEADISEIMICEGTTAKPFEPYTGGEPSPSPEYPQEIVSKAEDGQVTVTITGDDVGTQTLTVSTPNGLPGIPVTAGGNYTDETGQKWVCDEVDFKRGVYIQRVKKATGITWHIHNGYAVEGSELFSTNDITDGREGGNIPANIALCSKLKYDARILTFNINGFYEGYGRVFARIKGASDVEEFNQLMSGAEILYQLETPVETPLTPEELAAYAAMHTNYPTTTVMNDEGVYMELEYAADTETYIANNYVDKATYNALEDRVAALEGAAVANV